MSTVPYETLDDFTKNLSAMFGEVLSVDVGYIDVDMGKIPPFVTNIPGKHSGDCFVFEEISTKICTTKIHATIMLIEAIEDYVYFAMTPPRDTSKATLVWRINPEINTKETGSRGYARVLVLDKDSKPSNY